MRPGVKQMGMGIALAVLGAVITGVTYEMASGGGTYVVTWGLMVVGAIQFVMGLFQFLKSATMGSEARENESAKLLVQTIVQCMVHVANADGTLHADEIGTIKNICKVVFGSEVDEKTIREIAAQPNPFVGSDYLSERHYLLTPERKETIIKACILVAGAEGGISDDEQRRIRQVLTAIGAGPETLEHALAALASKAAESGKAATA